MAEAVHRRYSRLIREAAGTAARGEEEGRGIASEFQKVVDETSARVRRKPAARAAAAPQDEAADEWEDADPGESGEPAPEGASATPARTAKLSGRDNLPDLILIDGGKGQLNAAVAELKKLGLERIPVIGLAKEFEEIHRPGEPTPLRLGLDSPAVKLLQRVRDESHRVANSYNAQLRLRKISESLLDEFPGIGEARKSALLKKFGSVQRLRLATVEQIAEVPGFGGRAAADLKAFLAARQASS